MMKTENVIAAKTDENRLRFRTDFEAKLWIKKFEKQKKKKTGWMNYAAVEKLRLLSIRCLRKQPFRHSARAVIVNIYD